VVANSTVGLSALQANAPVIALGTAIYDLPELTFKGALDDFWGQATPPDQGRLATFLSALAASIQVPGGFDGEGAKPGAEALAEKMLSPPPY
ncbi:MAG: capsular biosynthesis protein, partial [Pseudomonadota bacterium]